MSYQTKTGQYNPSNYYYDTNKGIIYTDGSSKSSSNYYTTTTNFNSSSAYYYNSSTYSFNPVSYQNGCSYSGIGNSMF
jgi:phage major head subunit gpT-like protein